MSKKNPLAGFTSSELDYLRSLSTNYLEHLRIGSSPPLDSPLAERVADGGLVAAAEAVLRERAGA